MNPSRELPCYMNSLSTNMLQIENERFKLKNAANTLETAASSSKMLQIPPKCCKFYGEVPTPKCCKDSWNGSFQLQHAANRKENRQKSRSQKNPKAEKHAKTIDPKTIPDPFGFEKLWDWLLDQPTWVPKGLAPCKVAVFSTQVWFRPLPTQFPRLSCPVTRHLKEPQPIMI